ncbi:MAG: YihY family inner membrane protein [Sedimentisphaerales bacterium]|nr:YihY family inner membrane protein [Sedimentisphaerales bacterium]
MRETKKEKPEGIMGFLTKFRRENVFRELLSTPTFQLGRAGRFLVFQIKLWSHCARLLRNNRAGNQAAALSYYTIFGIVPLAIVGLLFFQSLSALDVGENVKSLVYHHLQLQGVYITQADGDVLLTDYVDTIVQKFYEGLNKGSLTFVSGVIVIWAALALLSKIEKAFNNIWRVARGRGFVQRMINYWAILTLGPLVVGLGVYISTRYEGLGQFQRTILSFSSIAPPIVSYLVAVVVFFLLYFVLPNTKVQVKSALWAAAVAALVWTLAKWGFGEYVTKFIPYSKLYGVIGLVPLGVFWIFLTWLIVLFGLQLTYTTQHLETLDAAEIAAARKREDVFVAGELTAVRIVREICESFVADQGPLSAEVLCSRLDIPAELGQKIIDLLVAGKLLARTSDPHAGYVPAKDPARIKLSDITDAITPPVTGKRLAQSDKLADIAEARRAVLAEYSVKQILDSQDANTGGAVRNSEAKQPDHNDGGDLPQGAA